MELIKDKDLSKLVSGLPDPLTDEQANAARMIILRLSRGAMAEKLNLTILAHYLADSHFRAILKEGIKNIEMALDATGDAEVKS